jgi:hypothetical protein
MSGRRNGEPIYADGAMPAPLRALFVCLLLAALHTWPLVTAPHRLSLNYNADAEQGAWTLSWVAHTLPRAPHHLFDGNIFAPEQATLAYSEPMIAPALVGVPLRWLGASPVTTYNIVLIAGLTLTAWAGWFVAWRWTGSFAAGLVAGALTAFNAHLLTRLPHVMAAHAWGIPLSIYLSDRVAASPNRRDALLLALVVLATASNSIYWLALVGLVVGVTAIANVRRPRAAMRVIVAALGGLLLATPVLWPYIEAASAGASRPLSVVAQFSASPAGYLTSLSRLHRGWTAGFFRDDVNVLFAGVTALVLAFAGTVTATWQPAHRRRVLVLLTLGASAVLLSFGPLTSLYRWLYSWVLPLRGLRAMARFGYLYLTVVAQLAAIGVAWVQSRVRSSAVSAALAGVALALVTAEAWMPPRLDRFTRIPPIYTLLARPASRVMLVEVPFYPPDTVFMNGEYMLNSTAHWQPLMNGTSGVTPMSYRTRADWFWYFPKDWAIDQIKKEGATHIMVHLEKFAPAEVEDIITSLPHREDLQLVASDARGHRLYRFE